MRIRKAKLMAIVAGASLGLSACSVPVALSDTNATLGASQFLQVHLTANLFAHGASAAKVIKVLKKLSFDMNYQSANGAPLGTALNSARSELIISNATERVATIVDVNSNEYLNVNIPSLAHIPGLGLSATKLAPVNLLLGGRWIEFPHSLLAKYETSTLHLKPTAALAAKNEIQVVDALVSFLAKQPTTTTATGYTQTGTLASLVNALTPLLKSTVATPITTTAAKGSYKLALTMSGNVATAASLAVTTPNGKYGDATLTLTGTFARDNVPVTTPSNALVITNSLIKQLSGGASGLLGGSLG
ncbi:MAG: hypothetical protein KGL23_08175 [Acidobacteriota bacterium]|nr:hypothetical protein [Acidobacteriota bacterium]MDE3147393.1 hypothetical protein [Acidobacteriota bacterium]